MDPMETLTTIRNLEKQKLFPNNCQRDLFSTLHNLKQGNKSVVKYMQEFNLIQASCDLGEQEDIVAHQYYHGLKLENILLVSEL